MKTTEDFIFQILLGFLTAAGIILTSAIKKWRHIPSNASDAGRMASSSPALWSRLKKCKVCKRRENSLLSYVVCAAFAFFSSQTRAERRKRLFSEQKQTEKKGKFCARLKSCILSWLRFGAGTNSRMAAAGLKSSQQRSCRSVLWHCRGENMLCWWGKSTLGLSCTNYTKLRWLCCFDETFISALNHQQTQSPSTPAENHTLRMIDHTLSCNKQKPFTLSVDEWMWRPVRSCCGCSRSGQNKEMRVVYRVVQIFHRLLVSYGIDWEPVEGLPLGASDLEPVLLLVWLKPPLGGSFNYLSVNSSKHTDWFWLIVTLLYTVHDPVHH